MFAFRFKGIATLWFEFQSFAQVCGKARPVQYGGPSISLREIEPRPSIESAVNPNRKCQMMSPPILEPRNGQFLHPSCACGWSFTILMRSRSLWLSLGIPLGSCLAFTPGQDHQASSNVRFSPQEVQETFDVAAFHGGAKSHTGTIYSILSNDPRFVFRWSQTSRLKTLTIVFRFSLITKALNFVEDVASFLNDPSSV